MRGCRSHERTRRTPKESWRSSGLALLLLTVALRFSAERARTDDRFFVGRDADRIRPRDLDEAFLTPNFIVSAAASLVRSVRLQLPRLHVVGEAGAENLLLSPLFQKRRENRPRQF